MTARVINDPAALGWEFDPDTGRWTWGGSGSGSGGGGGDVDLSDYVKSTTRNYVSEGAFQIVWDDSSDPNYPFNGRIGYNSQSNDPNSLDGSFLYINGTKGTFSIGRDGDVELHGASEILGVEDRLTGDRPWITGFSYVQAADFRDADGNSIIGSGGGGGGNDPRITNQQITNWDISFGWGDHKGLYVETESDPTVPQHVKDISQADINNWNAGTGGGGGDVDLTGYATESWVSANYQVKGNYLTSSSLNGYATETWVGQNYQPKGSYAATSHNHSGVYAPVSHTHNYAAVGASYTKAESDNKYALKGASGFNGTYSGADVTFTCTNTIYALKLSSPNAAIFMTGGGHTGKYMRLAGDKWEILTGNYATSLMSVNDSGIVTATDFIATSDRNKKDHIETAPTGVIEKLRGVTFQWKDTGKESSGVVAQELQDAGLGHLVHEDDDGLSVAYAGLTAYLIEEVKLLRKELEALKGD